jgi:hypothetical protein
MWVAGAVIVKEPRPYEIAKSLGLGHSITIRIEDADSDCSYAKDHRSQIIQELSPIYLQRQYTAQALRNQAKTDPSALTSV